jgi:plasmid stability protein
MRTTVDIPDELYRKLKIRAAEEGKTVKELFVQVLEREFSNDSKSLKSDLLSSLPIIRFKEGSDVYIPSFREVEEEDDLRKAKKLEAMFRKDAKRAKTA